MYMLLSPVGGSLFVDPNCEILTDIPCRFVRHLLRTAYSLIVNIVAYPVLSFGLLPGLTLFCNNPVTLCHSIDLGH